MFKISFGNWILEDFSVKEIEFPPLKKIKKKVKSNFNTTASDLFCSKIYNPRFLMLLSVKNENILSPIFNCYKQIKMF